MANSRCRTWSGSSRTRTGFAVARLARCFAILLWLTGGSAAAQAEPDLGPLAQAERPRERTRKRRPKKKKKAAPKPAEEAPEEPQGLEPGADLPPPRKPFESVEQPVIGGTPAPEASDASPDTGAPETIDLGDGSGAPEAIDLGEGTSAPEAIDLGTTAAPEAEPEQLDFQLRGWARTRANQTWLINQVRTADGQGVPYEPTLLEQQLFLEVRYAKNRWFEAVASGLLGYTIARHEAQARDGTLDVSARSLLEPSLREIYVGAYTQRFAGRIGQQRIAWGNSDAFTINDVLNPRDLREPVLAETDVFRVPSPFVRVDWTESWGGAQLVVAPFFRPDVFDVYGTNWALIQPDAPLAMRGAVGQLSNLTDPSLREPTQVLLRQTSLPRDDFTATSAGARFNWSLAQVNVSHYYFFGYTSTPVLRIDPALFAMLGSVDWSKATVTDLAPVLASAGTNALSSTYERNHHAGTSAQLGVGSFLLRAEAAYDSARALTSRQLLSVLRPVAQAVLGVEYQPGEDGRAIIVEGLYQRIFGQDPGPLLGAEVNGFGAAAVVRWTFFDDFELEVRSVASIAPRGGLVRPQLAYKRDFWELRLGAVWLDGEAFSQQHYYRRNQTGYAMAKLKF